MSNYNLYVVGTKCFLYNTIKVLGVFPNEPLAFKFHCVYPRFSNIFVVGQSQIKFSDSGIEIPFYSKILK